MVERATEVADSNAEEKAAEKLNNLAENLTQTEWLVWPPCCIVTKEQSKLTWRAELQLLRFIRGARRQGGVGLRCAMVFATSLHPEGGGGVL